MTSVFMLRPRAGRALLPFCAAGLLAPASALAVTKPKPGLWQQYTESKVNGTDVIAAMGAARAEMMKSLTPEQRAQMEKQLGGAGADPHLVKLCLTPEQVARINDPQDFIEQLNRDRDTCEYGRASVKGEVISFHGSCSGDGNFNGYMDGTLTVKSPTAYAIHFSGDGAVYSDGVATPMRVQGDIEASWLGADCGDVPAE